MRGAEVAAAISVSGPVSGTDKTLSFETGKLAPQADGAVVVRMGDTIVLVTATAARSVRQGVDFFPLTVDIEERMYAAGKIPGSFFRREGKASDQAILTCRLIDRPLRPSFPKDFRNEVHIVGTILGADQVNPHDVLAINAASAALMISGIPFDGPVGAVRVGYTKEGTWVPHATYQEGDDCTFELVVAGRSVEGDVAIMMVEAGGTEEAWQYYQAGAPKVTEEVIAEGLETAKTWINESMELQRQLVERAGAKPTVAFETQVDYDDEIWERVSAVGADPIAKASTIATKAERNAALEDAGATIRTELADAFEGRDKEVNAAIKALVKKVVRKRIVEEGLRIDGRGPADIRPLNAEVGLIPTAHGSALFERGETQVLNISTLGMPRMDQLLDTIGVDEKKRYMHHYNFPPFSTGETGFMRGPKRREIGHGLLAERALFPVVPSFEDFPYTIRVVSDVLSSNGSTSMASVCGSSLSLMDAGVPIKAPVAGIAMGLVFAEGRYTTLTDILGAEDAFGDMDFKVAGTKEFVTALQLDTKLDGIPSNVLAAALQQARTARLAILEVMNEAIDAPDEMAPTAPRVLSVKIPVDKIGEVIGPKGKMINQIQADTGADITVEDDGTIYIGATDGPSAEAALATINMIANPTMPKVGERFLGTVVKTAAFGAFVSLLPGKDGLVHISKLGNGKRIGKVEDVVNVGDKIQVEIQEIDQRGKISLVPVQNDAPAEAGAAAE
ncbi:MAG: polyribonucleotide nucleotidyltransferase [Actinomycetota bacterium]|nr:polyribonucleotide nucleotidyltransferase [Actinomycetota bacterium]